MTQAQDGDRQAYEDLLTRVSRLVQAFVRRRVGDAQWSEDVVQDSLVALHRARHTYDGARRSHPRLYAIVQNRLIDAPRVQRRRLMRELQSDSGTRAVAAAASGARRTARGRQTSRCWLAAASDR